MRGTGSAKTQHMLNLQARVLSTQSTAMHDPVRGDGILRLHDVC